MKNIVLAEQSGSSPESGATSRIKTIYDSLVALTHGSDSAGGWGNWGAYWNRIRSAGEWVPSGDADEADVASGKTFYKNSRTQKTGTASLCPDYSKQDLQDHDDCRGNMNCSSTSDEDTTAEEAVWSNTAGSASTGVWQDTRTSLYWSADQGAMTNIFTRTQTTPGTWTCTMAKRVVILRVMITPSIVSVKTRRYSKCKMQNSKCKGHDERPSLHISFPRVKKKVCTY